MPNGCIATNQLFQNADRVMRKRKMTKKKYVTSELIALNIPVVDPPVGAEDAYQRKLDLKRVKEIAKAFDVMLVNAHISLREDGIYATMDGQHCTAGAVAAGHGDLRVPMKVYHNLTLADESKMFRGLNYLRKGMKAFELFNAQLKYHDPESLEIVSILKKQGCHLTRSTSQGGVRAIAAVLSAYKVSPENLKMSISTLYKWLDGAPEAFDNLLIRTMSAFFETFGDLIDQEHLVTRLQIHTPSTICNQIKRDAKLSISNKRSVMISTIVALYNKGTRRAKWLKMDLE